MAIIGTEQQLSFAFGLASLLLASETIAASVRRGDISLSDASELYARTRQTVEKISVLFPGDPEVVRIAKDALALFEQMTAAYSAEKPPEGAH